MRAHHLIQISDSHLRADDPANTDALDTLVTRINALIGRGIPVDLVVHTGDITDDGDAPDADDASTQTAGRVLSGLDAPYLVVGGNHDRRCWLTKVFPDTVLGNPVAAGLRKASVGGLDCLLIDANPENGDDDLSGKLTDAILEALDRELAACRQPALLLMHYPLERMAVDGWMAPVIGGDTLHRLLSRHARSLHCVLSGHVHCASARLLDGVLYVSATGCRRHFLHWPHTDFGDYRNEHWGFNFVRIDETGTQVQFHPVDVDSV